MEYPCGTSNVHPTQKNYYLIKHIIEDNTNKGDLVMDMCMGSGTTGKACVETSRDFIGVELDKTYFDIASKRINKAIDNYQPSLF